MLPIYMEFSELSKKEMKVQVQRNIAYMEQQNLSMPFARIISKYGNSK